MEKQTNNLNKIILALTILTNGALLVASISVISNSMIPLYSWYLAIISMSALSLIWLVMFAMLAVKMSIKWYEQEYHHEGEIARSWKWIHEE